MPMRDMCVCMNMSLHSFMVRLFVKSKKMYKSQFDDENVVEFQKSMYTRVWLLLHVHTFSICWNGDNFTHLILYKVVKFLIEKKNVQLADAFR